MELALGLNSGYYYTVLKTHQQLPISLKSSVLVLVYKALYSLVPLYLLGHFSYLLLVTLTPFCFSITNAHALGTLYLILSARKLLPRYLFG